MLSMAVRRASSLVCLTTFSLSAAGSWYGGSPVLAAAPQEDGPSCGELGGDHCSKSGGCPAGYESLGSTFDCNPCCKTQPPPDPGPSCGSMGGDHCSQSGACPGDHTSLGSTYDCNPCCRYEPPQPTCGALGGNYCGGGSCPDGYESLGGSSDCNPCCKALPQVYVYSDEHYDGETLHVHTEAESDAPGAEVRIEVSVTTQADGVQLAGGSATGYPLANLDLSTPLPAQPPHGEVQAFDGGGTLLVLAVVAKVFLGGLLRRVFSWFKKVKVGASRLCYIYKGELPGDQGTFCEYEQRVPCNVTCASQMPLFAHLKTPYCYPEVAFNVGWKKEGSSLLPAYCAKFGVHVPWPQCWCAEVNVK